MTNTALGGIRVLDLSSGIAGPIAGMMLADFGADVLKIEPPSGDPARGLPGFAMWNRNKRGIVLDQRSETDRQRLGEFLAGADVCVVSEARASLAGTALDPPTVSAAHPHLVYVHTAPYTPDDVPWCGAHESHELLSALAGAACRQSSFDGGPIDLVYPILLYVQGVWAAAATVAALIERQRSGFGQVVSVSGIHGAMVSCAGTMGVAPAQESLPTNVGPGGRHPTYTTYQGSDGRWLFLAALTPKFQANAFRVLGVGDLFADERIRGAPARIVLPENRGWIRQRLSEAFRERTRDEWLELLEQGDCPAGPLGDREDWLDHPQIEANGLRVELDDPERGQVVMPGPPLVLTKAPASVRTPAPRLGEHTGTTRPWPPRPTPVGVPLPSSYGPLAGYSVLNLGTILAGPYAGALLAELGADVIKVESPAGDPFRETGFIYNRGQRGLAIDLSSPAARDAFYAMVRRADAILDNSRLGVLERLKVDYASLVRVNPDIVTMSVRGFGEQGPLASKPAFDPVLQAMSGMMTAQGGDSDPVLFTIPVNDIAAATVAVLGICLGLFHRARAGVGQRMWTSLVGCSTLMQSGELVRFAGRAPAQRGGRDFAGPSELNRFYPVADGWVRVQGSAEATNLERCAELSNVLAAQSAAEALAWLSAAGIPAVGARRPADLTTDPALLELELFGTDHLEDGTAYSVTKRYAGFSRTQEHRFFTAPGIGEHSRQVLAEAGIATGEIETLIEKGVVTQGLAFRPAALSTYR